jgi:chromosome segregation ATPase
VPGLDPRAALDWAIDTGTPGEAPAPPDRARGLVLARAALASERDALRALIPPDDRAQRDTLERQIDHLKSRLGSLRASRSQDPAVQGLDRQWARIRRQRADAERRSEDPSLSRRERRRWGARAETLRAPECEARLQLERAQERAFTAQAPQLQESLAYLEARHDELHTRLLERLDWLERHPELERRLGHLEAEISGQNRALEVPGLGMAPEVASLNVDIGFGPEL